MEEVISLFIPIIITLGAFTMIILLNRMEHQEKMAMIERGLDMSKYRRKKRYPGSGIRLASISVGIGAGLLMGNLLDATTPLQEEVCYFSMIFIFAGLGLIIANKLIEKKEGEKSLRENVED